MFSPPYDWAAIAAKQTVGDMALLAVVDSRERAAMQEAAQAVFPALIHLGMPYAVHDLASGPLAAEEMRGYRAVLLCQEGVGRALSRDEQAALLAALEAGIGIVSFDSQAPIDAPFLARGLGLSGGSIASCAALRAASNDLFVTHTREAGRPLKLIRPVPLVSVAAQGEAPAPLLTDGGAPAVVPGRRGNGRFIHWCLSPKVWLNDYLGHANGLDDVFWRGIVWAARKPFVMKAMPPFVTVRIDDCQGRGGLWWNVQQCLRRRPLHIPEPIQRMLCEVTPGQSSVAHHFAYIDVFNKHGIIPAVGVFCDQVTAEDRAILKRYYDAGKAEFSLHAFSEYADYDLDRVTEFLYQRGWHQSDDGAYIIDEYTPQELVHRFQRADRFWADADIRPSRVINSHYTNPGVNSLPFLKARGQDMVMLASLFGRYYDSHYRDPWSRAPYGNMGLIFDYLPVPEGLPGVKFGDFFNAEAHVYDPYMLAETGEVDDGNIDFTVGSTMKGCLRDDNDLQAAAEGIIHQVRIGLDSLFFGCMMAHEQGLAVLTVAELDEILDIADRALGRYDMLFASYERIAEYARCKVDSHIERLEQLDSGVLCRLSGTTTLPLQLYVFADDGEGCRQVFHEIPAFSGGLTTILGPGGWA